MGFSRPGFAATFAATFAVRICMELCTKMMFFSRSPHANEKFDAKRCSRPVFCSKILIHMRRTRKKLMFLVLKKEGNQDIELERNTREERARFA